MIDRETAATLVTRAQRGDAEAFGPLVEAFLRAAYVVALGIVGRPADAEDVAQDAFVIALERIAQCRDPQRFAGWLLQIVRNRARNWRAGRRLRERPAARPAADEAEPHPVERLDLRERLLEALGTLSSVQREVVLLHDLDQWTHPEIAAALGLSPGMSRQHLFNARRRLRELLAEDAQTRKGP